MQCCKVRVEEGKQGGEGPKGKGQPAEGFKCDRKNLGKGSQHQEGGALLGDEHKLGACDPDNAGLTCMHSWYKWKHTAEGFSPTSEVLACINS